MKKLLFLFSTLCLSLPALNIQSQSLDDMIIDYEQNSDRALARYMDKAMVTVTFPVTEIDSVHFFDKRFGVSVFCNHGKYYNSLQCEGLKYSDAIKMDIGDSITVTGLLSSTGTGASRGNNFKNVLLKNARLIGIVYKDSDYIKSVLKQSACPDCDTGLKIYHDFMAEYELNALRARRDYFKKPLTFYVQVDHFQSTSTTNGSIFESTNFPYQLYRGGVGCLLIPTPEQQKKHGPGWFDIYLNGQTVCIAVYGLSTAESESLNVNQRFKVRGLLTKSFMLEGANRSQNAFNMITLYHCSIVQ